MDGTTAADILLRIKALRQLGADCGGGKGRRWILLARYNVNITKKHPHAITLSELLGVREESMKENFGNLWRGAFKKKQKGLGIGFTHRDFTNISFITIGDGDDVGSDAPHMGNIVHKGSVTLQGNSRSCGKNCHCSGSSGGRGYGGE